MMKEFSYKLLLSILFMVTGLFCETKAQPSVRLKPLGQVVIPYNQSFKGTPVGGLSGLTYDAARNQFYVISDDRSEEAPARFYTIKVQLNTKGELKKGGIQFKGVNRLKKPDGKPYPKGSIDPEGIAIGPDQLVYVSSEGVPKKNIAPFVNGYSAAGDFARALTIPKAFWDSTRSHYGVRSNLAFEGLTTSPDASTLYVGTENALKQDGAAADSTHGSPTRMIVYDMPSANIMHEYEYPVEPVHYAKGLHGKFAVNGLSDILALDNRGHLLAIERNYVAGQGNHINLYRVSTRGATDVKKGESLKQVDQTIHPVQKKLVAHLRDFDITIDNFEGLALGPKLTGGGRLLLMVSDNNFSPLQQTIFTAFFLKHK